MNDRMMLAEHTPELFQPAATGRKRNLGGAMLLAAIDDYRSLDEGAHLDASQFLFPQTVADQHDLDWVVAMTDGMNGRYLRETLDRLRGQWDMERMQRRSGRRQYRRRPQ